MSSGSAQSVGSRLKHFVNAMAAGGLHGDPEGRDPGRRGPILLSSHLGHGCEVVSVARSPVRTLLLRMGWYARPA